MILRADARHIPLAAGTVQCVTTSPPYWSLRDYQVAGQIGLEATPEAYVETMVGVFREVWRVLKDEGTVWLNLGDSFAHNGACGGGSPVDVRKAEYGRGTASGKWKGREEAKASQMDMHVRAGLKPKDLYGMPWRVAFALQADGWYLRSDIVWAKPNPMPESVTDRPTRSHEYVFLLSKRDRYFYDADAIREPHAEPWRGNGERESYTPHAGRLDDPNKEQAAYTVAIRQYNPAGRNKRDVWTVNSEPTPEAHFATFPQKLIEPCILAGTSEKGECTRCGKNWVRVVEHIEGEPESYHNSSFTNGKTGVNGLGRVSHTPRGSTRPVGWRPQCACDAPTRPNLVLDCFLGSGTVGKVCERFGRRWVGLELSADYIKIAKRRSAQMGLSL